MRVEKFIADRLDLFLEDLETIVNIDSSSENLDGIEQVAHFFENRFKAIGLETNILKLGEQKVPCLQATTMEATDNFDAMFLGHMDTVFPKGEVDKRPFTKNDKKAFGPGVCDMKAGLLVALHALESLAHSGLLEKLSVCVIFTGDEEIGSRSSWEHIEKMGKKSQRVFVFEPCRPGYNFVLRRKGGGWFLVTAKGKSAHAGADPEKGSNAVMEIAHQIIAINGLNDKEKGTSANVTVIKGGDKVNIIPSQATAAVDIRVSKNSEIKRVHDFFSALPQKTHIKGATVSVTGNIERAPMEPDNKTLDLWQLMKSKAGQIGVNADFISTGGCSDGNITSALGVPTIDGMGPVGANSHSLDEFVELDSIIKIIQIVAETCASLKELK
jgi:glutamate carboxypeptidase